MKIETIQYPLALVRTNAGGLISIHMDQIEGSPRIGCELGESDSGWKVIGNNADPDCVSGVCPIK